MNVRTIWPVMGCGGYCMKCRGIWSRPLQNSRRGTNCRSRSRSRCWTTYAWGSGRRASSSRRRWISFPRRCGLASPCISSSRWCKGPTCSREYPLVSSSNWWEKLDLPLNKMQWRQQHWEWRHTYEVNMQVTEMQTEYFAPKEDIMLQNDKPSDLYLLVSGAVVCCVQLLHIVYIWWTCKSISNFDYFMTKCFLIRTFWHS